MTTQQLPPCLGDRVGGTRIWGKGELFLNKAQTKQSWNSNPICQLKFHFVSVSARFEQKHEDSTDKGCPLWCIQPDQNKKGGQSVARKSLIPLLKCIPQVEKLKRP